MVQQQEKQGHYKSYNNPERFQGMIQQPQPQSLVPNRYNTYNNFPQETQQINQTNQLNIPNEEDPEDFLAGRIYDVVEQYQPKLAGKITGMIKATGVKQMSDLLNNPTDLKNVINEAVVLIGKEKK